MNCEILQQDIQSLLEYFAKNMYRAKDCENGNDIMHRCNVLLQQDYSVIEISNSTGELSSHYPSTLLVPEYEFRSVSTSSNTQQSNGLANDLLPSSGNIIADLRKKLQQHQQQQQPQPQPQQPQTIYECTYDGNKLRDLINKARFARCRARFPLPVILYKGKYICRSATLSGGPEIYGRSGLDYLFYSLDSTVTSPTLDDEAYEARETSLPEETFEEPISNSEWQLFDRVRSQDIKLLKTLNVGTIVDFMVEKKKVKFGMNVTSSEKVDKEKRYSDFKIISLPYPGCEFFREYRDNNYSGEGLIFDWSQAHVDANIGVPEDPVSSQLNIDWENYKGWDLVKITQNYLKLLLKYLQENSSGLLIHCISGWDRTPLFVSLLRLSLWADGAIHQSLNAAQILYFTIAYDWLLFGHNLPDRLNKGEVIFFFCFYALKYITDDEYSILGQRYKSKHSSGSSSIGVIRTDSESMLDGILLDGESRGSSVSLNSSCSGLSGRSSSHHDTQTCISIGCNGIGNHNTAVSGAGTTGVTFTLGTGVAATPGATTPAGGISIAIGGTGDNGIGRHNGSHEDSLNSSNGNNGWLAHSHDSNSSIGCISNGSANLEHPLAWSPQSKRTSPVSVPMASRLRQRQESTSSLSVGSWQMISGNGSLRSIGSVTELSAQACPNVYNNLYSCQTHNPTTPNANQQSHHHHHAQHHHPVQHYQQHHHPHSNHNHHSHHHHHSQDSSCCTIIDDDCFTSSYSHDFYAIRRDRLEQVQTLFQRCYYSTIAFKFKSVPDSALGSLLGNFAEKVGLAHRTSV